MNKHLLLTLTLNLTVILTINLTLIITVHGVANFLRTAAADCAICRSLLSSAYYSPVQFASNDLPYKLGIERVYKLYSLTFRVQVMLP